MIIYLLSITVENFCNNKICTGEIRWKESNDVVGGMLGESLTIDCGSIGNPQPETHISNHNGFPLNSLFYFLSYQISDNIKLI